jgi:hypothetical protein
MDPTADPIGVCDLTPIQLFFDMWDRKYDPDPDFNNLDMPSSLWKKINLEYF